MFGMLQETFHQFTPTRRLKKDVFIDSVFNSFNLRAVLFSPPQKCVFCSNTTSHALIPPKPSFMVENQNTERKMWKLSQACLSSYFSQFWPYLRSTRLWSWSGCDYWCGCNYHGGYISTEVVTRRSRCRESGLWNGLRVDAPCLCSADGGTKAGAINMTAALMEEWNKRVTARVKRAVRFVWTQPSKTLLPAMTYRHGRPPHVESLTLESPTSKRKRGWFMNFFRSLQCFCLVFCFTSLEIYVNVR